MNNAPATRDSYAHLDDQELIRIALQSLVEELGMWGVPQTDNNEEFGDDTALGFARNALEWTKKD